MAQREGWIWYSANGRHVIDLTQFVEGFEKIRGGTGIGGPPVRIQRELVPEMAGARTLTVQHDVNEVTLPIYASAVSRSELHEMLERLVIAMDPTQGDGMLRHVRLDGDYRELQCRCVDGLRGDNDGLQGPNSKLLQLVFQAADEPYWLGPEVTRGFIGNEPTSWFPLMPLRLSSSVVIGDVSIESQSQVPAFPVWTIMGPGTAPRIENRTTGQVLELADVELEAGETLVIDARPYKKSVRGPDGSNWYRYLTQRQMWALQPGINNVFLNLGGSTEDSYVSLSYRQRMLTP